MKVLYKTYPGSPNSVDDTLETLDLPQPAYLKLSTVLEENARHLPPSGAAYQDWHVTFLRRFSAQDQRNP